MMMITAKENYCSKHHSVSVLSNRGACQDPSQKTTETIQQGLRQGSQMTSCVC